MNFKIKMKGIRIVIRMKNNLIIDQDNFDELSEDFTFEIVVRRWNIGFIHYQGKMCEIGRAHV